jgi:DNase/tRNase domain of colicin-like bacteriocin
MLYGSAFDKGAVGGETSFNGAMIALPYGLKGLGGLGASRTMSAGEGIMARGTPTGQFYSVAYEMELTNTSYPGVTRYMHFQEANVALDAAFKTNPMLEQLGISVPRSAAGKIIGKSPTNWVWHHNINRGVMQLVPKSQHPNIPGGIFWETMHPGGVGGYSIWGK